MILWSRILCGFNMFQPPRATLIYYWLLGFVHKRNGCQKYHEHVFSTCCSSIPRVISYRFLYRAFILFHSSQMMFPFHPLSWITKKSSWDSISVHHSWVIPSPHKSDKVNPHYEWNTVNPHDLHARPTKVLWPPEPGSPQVMTEPSARRAAKEPRAPWRDAWMAVLKDCVVVARPGGGFP